MCPRFNDLVSRYFPFGHNLAEGPAITVQSGDLSGEPQPAFHRHIDVGRIEFNPKADSPRGFRRDPVCCKCVIERLRAPESTGQQFQSSEISPMAFFDWLFGRSPEPLQRHHPRPTAPENWTPQNIRTPTRPTFAHAQRVLEGSFRFIALDVETASSDVASICQIGLACFQPDNQIQTFSMLVNRGTRFDLFNIQLHGIGPAHVADAPRFPNALRALLPLLTRHHLVQHSYFDKQAVTAACGFCSIAIPDLRWSDSVSITRRAWPELKGNGGHGLANLKRALNLQVHHHKRTLSPTIQQRQRGQAGRLRIARPRTTAFCA